MQKTAEKQFLPSFCIPKFLLIGGTYFISRASAASSFPASAVGSTQKEDAVGAEEVNAHTPPEFPWGWSEMMWNDVKWCVWGLGKGSVNTSHGYFQHTDNAWNIFLYSFVIDQNIIYSVYTKSNPLLPCIMDPGFPTANWRSEFPYFNQYYSGFRHWCLLWNVAALLWENYWMIWDNVCRM